MVSVIRRKADWTDVRQFWAVAEMGSFGAAARRLGAGLTTVTRAVDIERFHRQRQAGEFARIFRAAVDYARTKAAPSPQFEAAAFAKKRLVIVSTFGAPGPPRT